MAGATKETREIFLPEKGKERTKRRGKARVVEDAIQMQERYVSEGYFNVAEIAFLMANDSYETLQAIEQTYGSTSKEYNQAFTNANTAVKTALPYFSVQMKPVTKEGDGELDESDVENALLAILQKSKK